MQKTSADWFVEALKGKGVEWIATLCGHGLDPLYQAARAAGLRLVDVRNEQTAGYIAECHGRLTRRPGVCAVSSGIAHANALTGVVNAWFDGTPMLLVSGAGDVRTEGMGHFQDLDQVAMAAPVTRYARTLAQPERTLQVLGEAWQAAANFPTGPVHLSYPLDVQAAPVSADQLVRSCAQTWTAPAEAPPELAAMLAHAERPLIVAGSGAWWGGEAGALVEFAERFSIPLTVPIWDRGAVDLASAVFMGVIGAASGGPSLLADADCIVLAGARPDYRAGFLQPPAIREDAAIFRAAAGWQALAERYQAAGGGRKEAWLAEAQRRRDEWRAVIRERGARQARRGLHSVDIVEALRPVLARDAALLIDGGSVGQWIHQLACDRYPSHWLTCGPSGVVGWGLGGAIAARLTFPDRPVILVSGDGAFTFTVAELEVAARQRLPFVAIVADDEAWGITRTGHQRKYGSAISSDLGPIAFDRLAESLGARGVRAESREQLAAAIEEALASGEVTVIHVPVVGGDPSEEG